MFTCQLPSLSSQPNSSQPKPAPQPFRWLLLVSVLIVAPGCNFSSPSDAQSQPPSQATNQTAAVDATIAQPETLLQPREYTGTTQPIQEVSVRAQVEGQLVQLNVNVGDRVEQGQILARVDSSLLNAAVTEAESELASRQAEVAQLQTQISDAQTQVERARLELRQAEADAARYEQLVASGAGTRQQAEQARTEAKTAAQLVRSAQAQVNSRQNEVAAAKGRVTAQRAVVAQARERLSYANLRSPISGDVLSKVTEVGNLVQPGGEIVRIGDFSREKVMVQVSDQELRNIRVGQSVRVRLDARPNQQFTGTVARISPAANSTSRLLPVEIAIQNPTGQNGSGLLARVTFEQPNQQRVVVPITALQVSRSSEGTPGQAGSSQTASQSNSANRGSEGTASQRAGRQPAQAGTIFVIGEGNQATVSARKVTIGEQADGRAEIITGLRPGDRYVTRSSRPLKDGETVRLSILSQPQNSTQNPS